MKRVAITVVYASECDTILKIAETQIGVQAKRIYNDSLLLENNKTTIAAKDSINALNGEIITVKDEESEELKEVNNKLANKLVAVKVAWAGSVGGLLILWVLIGL